MSCSGSTVVLLLTIWVARVALAQDKGIKPKAEWDAQYLKGPFPAGAADRYNGPQNPNPQVPSKYELIEPVSRRGVVAVHLTHVPGTDRYLYLSRPDCGQIAGSFDLVTQRWTNVESPDSVFCSGHAVTANGSVIVTGGHSMKWSCHRRSDVKSYMKVAADRQGLCKDGKVLVVRYEDGMRSIREYSVNKDATKLPVVAQMTDPRWYPTSTLLPDGKIMIMGGTRLPAKKDRNTHYEVFDPAHPGSGTQSFAVEEAYLKAYPYNYYPFNFVLPTGDMFNFCKRISRVLIPQTGQYRKVKGHFVAAPSKPKPAVSQYPHSGSAVMTALRPPYNSVDIVIFGGSDNGNCDPNRAADRKAYRMRIDMSSGARGVPQYKFSEWQVESMGIPRLMPDATLLPNGKVIVQNGAQTGCAGDAGPMGSAKAKYPALWAELYEPEKPLGKRYTILSASSIARMYHSTAALTTNGTILVSGCDRAGDSAGPGATITDAPWISRPLARHCETRQEIFHPPYTLQEPRKQPRITSVRGNLNRDVIIQLGYDEEFTLTWDTLGGAVRVSDATLVAPSSTTHSFNTNQRVVFLPKATGSSRPGVLKLRTPPHPYIAPPQMYMLFALNGDYYGQSWWVQLVDKAGAGKQLPPV